MRSSFAYEERPNFPPRYNIAPAQPVPLVRKANGKRHFALLRWGFVPSWAKEIDARGILINARAESLLQRASFKNAIRRRRAIFMMSGFYEWQKQGRGPKQPWYITQQSGAPFAVAGIWEHWMSADGAELETAALITVDANAQITPIHNRMPALLARQDHDLWLDEKTPVTDAVHLLKPAPDGILKSCPVSTRVNAVANDSPELIAPIDEPAKEDKAAPAPQPDLFD
jgi:putative SOS response-associated peptidase YedK